MEHSPSETQAPPCAHLELVPPGQLECDMILTMCAVDNELHVVFVDKESAVFVYDTEAARRQLLEPTAGQRSDDKIRLQATRGVYISDVDNDFLMRRTYPGGTLRLTTITVDLCPS